MITSTLIQAAQVALDELHAAYPSEEDADEAISIMGIGPRSLNRFTTSYTEIFEGDVQAAVLHAFLTGVFAERYRNEIDIDMISELDIEEIVGDQESYEGADRDDLQDLLSVVFGVQTDDEIDDEELAKLVLTNLFGHLGECFDDAEDETDVVRNTTGTAVGNDEIVQ